MDIRRIDCDTCPGAGRQCEDCLVTAIAGLSVVPRSAGPLTPAPVTGGPNPDQESYPLTAVEVAAVSRFVAAGLVSPDDASGLRARAVRHTWDAATG